MSFVEWIDLQTIGDDRGNLVGLEKAMPFRGLGRSRYLYELKPIQVYKQ